MPAADKMILKNIGTGAAMPAGRLRPGRTPALLLTLAGTAVVWAFLSVYYRKSALEEIRVDLLTINSFKAAQISDWVDFHRRETVRLSRHPFLGEIVGEELARPGSRRAQLTDWLKDHDTQKKYSGMAMLTVKGGKIVATPNYNGGTAKEFLEALAKAGQKGQPVFTDLYLSSTGKPLMAMVSPVFRRGYGAKPVCVLVATIDAETEFYPLVKADPLFFPSAESLLVRRQGDSVLFLNPLEHNSEAALKFKLPISSKGLPAAKALRGYRGFLEGTDYRGKDVYGGSSGISGTEWALITKIDKDIILGPVRTKEFLSLALLILASLSGYVAVTGVMGARDRAAQEKIREGERRLAALLSNLPGVAYRCLNDKNWTMEFLSQGCLNVTGYSPDAILGNREISFEELIVPEDRDRVRRDILEQIAGGGTYICTYSIKTRGGEIKTVWDQGQVITGADGTAETLEGYIQDISPLRQAEASLRQSEFVFSKFMEHSPIYVFFKDENMRSMRLSRNFEKMLGRPLNELLGKSMDELFPSDLARSMIADDKRVLAEGKQAEVVEELNGRTYRTIKFPIAIDGKPAYLAGYTMDITESRRAEAISLARIRLLQFAAGHTLDELLEETLNEAEKISGSLIGFFHFVEEDQETLWLQNWSTRTKAEFCSAEGKGSHYAMSKAGVWTDCVRERRAVIHNDYASLPHRKGMPPGHAEVKRELVVPVLRRDKIVAILGVGNKASDYGGDDVHDLSLLADLAWEIAERKLAEENLGKVRERLELAAAASRFGVWDWDIIRNVLVWDDRMLQLYGLTKDNFRGAYEAWLNGVHPDDRAASDEASTLAVRGEKDYDTEFRVVWPDGSVHHLKAVGVVFRDPAGKASRIVGINYDITERKQAEEKLRQTTSYLENLLAYSNTPIIVWGPDMRVTMFNQAFERLTGRKAADVIGKELETLFPEGSKAASMKLIGDAIKGAHLETVEMPILRADGETRIALWNSAAIMSRDGSSPEAVIAQGQDITDRVNAEAALKRLQRLHDESERIGRVGGWELSLDTGKQVWTEEVYRIHEVGKDFDPSLDNGVNFYAPGSKPVIEAAVKRLIETGEKFDLELQIITAKGNLRDVHAIGVSDMQSRRLYGFFQDITDRKKAEAKLRESEKQLAMALDVGGAGTWMWDRESNKVFYDDRFNAMLGYAPGELPDTIDKALPYHNPEDVPGWTAKVDRYLKGETHYYESEHRIRGKSGGWEWVFTRGQLVKSAETGKEKLVGIAMNVTARKEVEELLRQSSALMKSTQSLARIGGWEWKMAENRMLWTEEMYKLHDLEPGSLGPTPEEYISRSQSCYGPEDMKEVMAAFDRCVKSGEPYDLEFRFTSLKGRKMWVRTTGKAEPEKGRPVKIVGTLSDITERKENERRIQESEQRLRSLWTHMAEGVALHEMVLDADGRPSDYRIVEVNPQFSEILGIDAGRVLGKLASEAYGVSPAPYLEKYGAVARSGIPEQIETYFEPLDKHFRISVAPWGKMGFATIFSDITAQWTAQRALSKAADEVRAKNKELEDLLYIASHDLRSPLVNMQGFSDNLARYLVEISGTPGAKTSARVAELLEKKIPEALNFISSSSAKMDTLINGLLRVSRLGRVALNMTGVDMDGLMSGLVSSVAFQAKEAGAEIRVSPLPKCIGDPAQLSNVFSNLLENAIKYRVPGRKPEIEIGGRTDGGMAEYYVSDNGRGLTESELAGDIWAMFYRGAGKGEIKGEGIGLTAAKRIVERHGGTIGAERLENGGSKFTVRLRALEVEA